MTSGLPKWAQEKYSDPYEYERATAAKLPSGRSEIASGAFSGDYDSGNPDWMFDNKRTDAASFIVSVDKFKTIEKRARGKGKLPGLLVNFNQAGESLAIVRESDFLAMIQALAGYSEV